METRSTILSATRMCGGYLARRGQGPTGDGTPAPGEPLAIRGKEVANAGAGREDARGEAWGPRSFTATTSPAMSEAPVQELPTSGRSPKPGRSQ